MLIPLGTDEPLRRFAWCTYALIVVNIFCFFFLNQPNSQTLIIEEAGPATQQSAPMDYFYAQLLPPEEMLLQRNGMEWYQFFTFHFANTGPFLLLIDMLFLFALGRALENKLGHLSFLAFYMGTGIFAGLCHVATNVYPIIGASGPICGLAALYLVLLPNSRVKVVYFVYFIGSAELPGLTFTLLYFCLDLLATLLSIRQSQGAFVIVYIAHVAGYAMGAAVGFLLLKTGVIPQSHNDLLYMINQYRRRQAFRRQVREAGSPWLSNPSVVPPSGTGAAMADNPEVLALRASIFDRIQAQEFDAAAELYDKLLSIDPAQTLTRQSQFDLANHLFAAQKHGQAAKAYELFLAVYRTDADANQVRLALVILYGRYLQKPDQARLLLSQTEPGLTDPEHKALARQLQQELSA